MGFRMKACCSLLFLLFVFGAESTVHLELSIDQHDCQVTVNNNADSSLKEERESLAKELEQLRSSYQNLTEQKERLRSTSDEMQARLEQLQKSHRNLVEQKRQLQSSFDQLQSRCNNITDLKRRLCVLDGFTLDGAVCYYYSKSTERKTWEQSRQHCRDKQSDLIIINSKEKTDLFERVVTRGWAVWIGLTDREEEGIYKWVDGTPLTSPTFWGSAQPNDRGGNRDCVYFYNGGSGEWGDASCSTTYRFMCERVV